MDRNGDLKIVKTVQADPTRVIRVNQVYILLISLPCVWLICYSRAVSRSYGEDTDKLLHDLNHVYPSRLVTSSWLEHDTFITTSSYTKHSWDDAFLLDTFIINFNWSGQLCLLFFLVNHLLDINSDLFVRDAVRFRWTTHVRFVCLCTLFAFLLVFGFDGLLLETFRGCRDTLIKWIEESVVEVTLGDKNTDKLRSTFKHPFTAGEFAPYYISYDFRYIQEDIVFTCEYTVIGGTGVEPVYETLWWNKNGHPIQVNDRMYVNVSIEAIDETVALVPWLQVQSYRIISTLTVQLIEFKDYGRYSCVYVNPVPWIKIEPKQFDFFTKSDIPAPQPMTPHPNCDCKPVPPKTKSYVTTSSAKPCFQPEQVCYREFELRMPEVHKKVITVNLNPGGILIDESNYHTIANEGDVQVDTTFEEGTDGIASLECCSGFVKIYWALFRKGNFIDFPLSQHGIFKSIDSTNSMEIKKYMCFCTTSSLLFRTIFYRDFYNTSSKSNERIEIFHPVSLLIQPKTNGTTPFYETLVFCNRDNTLCSYLYNILENSVFTFYTYDLNILFGILLSLYLTYKFLSWSRRYISKPLRRYCYLPPHAYSEPFPAIEGPPLRHLEYDSQRGSGSNNKVQNSCYIHDIYLAYDGDELYDRKVAKFVKSELHKMKLTIFDPFTDILGGQFEEQRMSEAIQASHRFVQIISKASTEDDRKCMEHMFIQDTIISQKTQPKNRMLVIQLDDCRVAGLHRVPCIRIPDGMKENFKLDVNSCNTLTKWAKQMWPQTDDRSFFFRQFRHIQQCGFGLWSLFILGVLVHFFLRSSLFVEIEPSPSMPDLDLDEEEM